ncbi:Allantoinase AllB [Balamuthia mandrillaris]
MASVAEQSKQAVQSSLQIFRSSRVVLDSELRPAAVIVRDGVILKVETFDYEPSGEDGEVQVLDFGDLILMPGLVDSHVHINEPGRTEWEGFHSATRSAAAGGVTTVVDMPLNCSPVTTSVEALDTKLDSTEGKLWVDVAMLGGIVPDNIDQIKPLVAQGVVGFKAFMVHSGIEEFPHVEVNDIRRAMQELADLEEEGNGVVFMFHAEVEEPISKAMEIIKAEKKPPHKYATFLESRPREAENRAIATIIELCREYRVPCHIVHLSSSDAIEMIRQAKKEGVPITAETTFNYLYFKSEEVPDGNTLYKCCPPIRETDNREYLWEALKDDVIELIVSDHSPCTCDLKLLDKGDFLEAWGGISSLQLGLSVVWTEAKRRDIPIPQLAKWLCYNTSKLVKLADQKGSIKPGLSADFCVWDPEQSFTVSEGRLHIKNKKTPYDQQTLYGVVQHTILRGQEIYGKGDFTTDKPLGQVLTAQ